MSDEQDPPNGPGPAPRSAAETATPQASATAATGGAAAAAANGGGQAGIDQESLESLLQQAESGIAEAAGGGRQAAAPPPSPPPTAFELGELEPGEINGPAQSLDLLGDVELDLRIELGRTMMRLEDVLELRGGSVVVLDKLAGDPVDIFVNGRLVARGEVLVMNDNFCVRVTELAGSLV